MDIYESAGKLLADVEFEIKRLGAFRAALTELVLTGKQPTISVEGVKPTHLASDVRKAFESTTKRKYKKKSGHNHGGEEVVWPLILERLTGATEELRNRDIADMLGMPISTIAYYTYKHSKELNRNFNGFKLKADSVAKVGA